MVFEEYFYKLIEIAVVILLIYLISHWHLIYVNKNASIGSKTEKKLENARRDISDLANYIRGLEHKKDLELQTLRQEVGKEVGALRQDKVNNNKVTSKGDVVIANLIDSLDDEEITERNIDAILGRDLNALTELGVITNDLKKIHQLQIKEENDFFSETSNLQHLCANLSKLTTIPEITDEIRTYLNQFTNKIIQLFKEIFDKENEFRNNFTQILNDLTKVIEILIKTNFEIEINKKNINKSYKNSKKKISKAFGKVKIYIAWKNTQLKMELLKGKKASQKIVSALQKEIKIAENNLQQMNQIYSNLGNSFSIFDKNYKNLTLVINVLKNIISNHKQKIKDLSNIETKLKSNLVKLNSNNKNFAEIKKSILNNFIYSVLNQVSNEIINFYNSISNLFEKDINFYSKEKEVSQLNQNYLDNINKILPIIKNLNSSNESIREGMAAILELMKVIVGGVITSQVVGEVSQIINGNKKEVIDEDKIVQRLQIINSQFSQENIKNSNEIEALISETQKKIQLSKQMGKRYGSYVGSIAQMLAQKSSQINNKVNKKVLNFTQSMQKRNEKTKRVI